MMEPCKHFSVTHNGDRRSVTAYFPEADNVLQQATSESHDNFDEIITALQNQDPVAYDLFDPEVRMQREYAQLTDRVSVMHGKIFFDLVETHDAVATHLSRVLDAGEDPEPIARFMERIAANPNEHSREHLYSWLESGDFTINADGKIICYKVVEKVTADDGTENYLSIQSGGAVVNGKPVDGRVPNMPGTVVQMPRNQVTFDPTNHCAKGLHVGNWKYVQWFGGSNPGRVVAEVEVDPADVVSVPNDHSFGKMRVWRYKINKLVESAYTGPIKPVEDLYDDEDVDEYDDYDYDDPDQEDGY